MACLDLHLIEGFPVVNADHRAHHLGDYQHIAQMRLDNLH